MHQGHQRKGGQGSRLQMPKYCSAGKPSERQQSAALPIPPVDVGTRSGPAQSAGQIALPAWRPAHIRESVGGQESEKTVQYLVAKSKGKDKSWKHRIVGKAKGKGKSEKHHVEARARARAKAKARAGYMAVAACVAMWGLLVMASHQCKQEFVRHAGMSTCKLHHKLTPTSALWCGDMANIPQQCCLHLQEPSDQLTHVCNGSSQLLERCQPMRRS